MNTNMLQGEVDELKALGKLARLTEIDSLEKSIDKVYDELVNKGYPCSKMHYLKLHETILYSLNLLGNYKGTGTVQSMLVKFNSLEGHLQRKLLDYYDYHIKHHPAPDARRFLMMVEKGQYPGTPDAMFGMACCLISLLRSEFTPGCN